MSPELWICVYYSWPWECLGCHPAKLRKTCLVKCVRVYVHGGRGGSAFGVCFGFLLWRFDAKKMNGKTIFLSCTFGDGLNSLCVGVATFIYSRRESLSQSAVESGGFFFQSD